MRGRGFVVRRVRSWPGPADGDRAGPDRLAGGGEGGVYIQLSGGYTVRIKPLRRGWSGPLPGPGPVRLVRLARPFSTTGATCPSIGPRSGPAPGPADAGRAGPAPSPGGAGRAGPALPVPVLSVIVRRLSMPPASSPIPARSSCPSPAPVRLPVRSLRVAPVPVRRGPPVPARLPVRRVHFQKQPRFFRPLHRAAKFPAIFPARYFMRAV